MLDTIAVWLDQAINFIVHFPEFFRESFKDADWRWEAFGLAGEGLFFARLLVQWAYSERARKPVLPVSYWYMSLAGAAILVFYAFYKSSLVLLLPQFIGIPMYARNLQLEMRARSEMKWRDGLGFDRPGFVWPSVSVIVPCHNEAKVLAQTLENLCSQQYSGPFPEIIVALNGCTDASWAVAQGFGVRVIEDEKCGMSFGKNLGARAATGELLIFVDADTQLPTGGLQAIVESMYGKENAIGTIAGAPDHGGLVVRACFILANRNTRRTQTHAPGGVMAMPYAVWKKLGGFDENILQGTSTDMILRALKTGAEYVFIDRIAATTSVRRFEKTGIVRQMLSWRNNHLEMKAGKRKKIAREKYEAYR